MMFKYILVALAVHTMCKGERVFIELANGGKSRPIEIKPMEHSHDYNNEDNIPETPSLPQAAALSTNITKDTGEENELRANIEIDNTGNAGDLNQITTAKMERFVSSYHEENAPEDLFNVSTPISTAESFTIAKTTITTTSTTEKESTSSMKPSARPQTINTSMLPTQSPQPLLPCHEECLLALNDTRLYSVQKEKVSQGTNITLICELNLSSSFILEDFIWLYRPDESLVNQCSLTTQEFVHSCQGFQTIQETDFRNDTFVQESITLTNVLTNYSGKYMCQVKLTCCPESKEHVMSQERVLSIKIEVWITDYITDLAIAGSITAALALVVIAGSFCIYHKQRAQYTYIADDIHEVKPCTVLHIPLVDDDDDDDNESFDSNFDEQE